jgi:predicted  nucleic acid-binding Zn-ribbon protein
MKDLRRVQQQIKLTEDQIKQIQSQISHLRSKRVNLGRVYRRPQFQGIPEDQVAFLENLKYEISVKRRRKAEIDSQNDDLQSVVSSQLADIEMMERQISELPDQIVRAVDSRIVSQLDHEVVSRDLAEKRLEVKAIQRLHKDAVTTLLAVSLRKDVPTLDRQDLKPLREQIGHLEREIRRTQGRCVRLEELIRLEEIELATPAKWTDDELQIFKALEDPKADSLEFDVLAMTQELKAKRKELRDVQDLVQTAHVRAAAVGERFDFSWGLSDEQRRSLSVSAKKDKTRRTFSALDGSVARRSGSAAKMHTTPVSSAECDREHVQ